MQDGGESTLQVYRWAIFVKELWSFAGVLKVGWSIFWCRGSITAIWGLVTLSDRVLQKLVIANNISCFEIFCRSEPPHLRWQKTCKSFIHLNLFLFPTLYWHHLITWGFETHSWSDGCVSYHVYGVMTYTTLCWLYSYLQIIEVFLLTPLSLTSSWVRAKLEHIYLAFAKGVSWREHLQWRSLWKASEQIFCYYMTLAACVLTFHSFNFFSFSFLSVSLRFHWTSKSAVSGLSIPALFLAFSYQYLSAVLYVLFREDGVVGGLFWWC